ncbi:malonic semialdehyde reductase [Sphingomonas montana]|uniref:malonic semialdehyde reductase n=1 Tax=Sphingomonas montana TaxID=1843236 RepID=UPI00096D5F76|nr:malonic semialdehyde reductase [Sphingomonas montana]
MTTILPDETLDQLFRTARSHYSFADTPVTEADMRAIWDLAKMGPTSANMLPARLVWCVGDNAKRRLADCASSGNVDKILNAPVTAIVGTDLDFPDHLPTLFPPADARSWYIGNAPLIETAGLRNSSLQAAYVILAARALGFDTGPMSGFDNAAVDAAFFAGTNIRSNLIVSVGHGRPDALHPRLPRPDFEAYNKIT